jgi:hypothetical protein
VEAPEGKFEAEGVGLQKKVIETEGDPGEVESFISRHVLRAGHQIAVAEFGPGIETKVVVET